MKICSSFCRQCIAQPICKVEVCSISCKNFRTALEKKLTSTNTTNGKIKPCSNKECTSYDNHNDKGNNCMSYHFHEMEDHCPDYRA